MATPSTSHFLGIILPSHVFVGLIIKLQEYVTTHHLHPFIGIQDVHSIHATLYYFEPNIPKKDAQQLRNFIDESHDRLSGNRISVEGYDYFERDEKKILLYLKPADNDVWNLHDELAEHFKRETIADNCFSFVPHITLLQIYDSEIYEKHRPSIETIISEFVSIELPQEIEYSIQLFAVFSQIKPEIQIPYTY